MDWRKEWENAEGRISELCEDNEALREVIDFQNENAARIDRDYIKIELIENMCAYECKKAVKDAVERFMELLKEKYENVLVKDIDFAIISKEITR